MNIKKKKDLKIFKIIAHFVLKARVKNARKWLFQENLLTCLLIYFQSASKKKLYLVPDQFEKFLNREQRDPGLNELLYPFYTTDKSAEMILKFETDESFRKKSKQTN